MKNLIFEIISMQLLASFIFAMVCILKPFTEKYQSSKWQYNILKGTALLFVIPIQEIVESLTEILNVSQIVVTIPNIINYSSTNQPYMSEMITSNNTVFSGANFNVFGMCIFIWCVGMALKVLWYLYCNTRFFCDIKNSDSVSDVNILNLLDVCKTRLGIANELMLFESDKITTPMLVGIRKPKILLPKKIINNGHLEYIFTHELVHFKRKDLWWKSLMLIIQTVYWFNPFIYLLGFEFEKNLEYSCDELVVNKLNYTDRKKYGMAIIESISVAKTINFSYMGVGFATTEQKIERRLTNMLNYKNMKKSTKIGISLGLIVICTCCILFTIFIQLDKSDTPTPSNPNTATYDPNAPWDPTIFSINDYAPYDERFVADTAIEWWTFNGKPIAGIITMEHDDLGLSCIGSTCVRYNKYEESEVVYVQVIRDNYIVEDFIEITRDEYNEIIFDDELQAEACRVIDPNGVISKG